MLPRLAASMVWLSCQFQRATATNHLNFILRSPSTRLAPHKRSNSVTDIHTKVFAATLPTFVHQYHQQRHQTQVHSAPETKTLLAPEQNQFHVQEEIVKKSRFIGLAVPCSSWDEAQVYLDLVRKDHPKSRHVCFGFVSGGGSEGGVGTERCSDDGEPTGTAGVPILGAIKGEGLSDTLCIVVRYFGGIKLGAGGLIRAYGSAARLVLRSSPTEVLIPKATMRLATRTANSGAVYAAAAKFGGVTSGETYNDRGELEVSVVCDEVDGERLKEEIVDATRGGVIFL